MYGNAIRFGGVLALTAVVLLLTPAASPAAGRGGIRMGGFSARGISAGGFNRGFPGSFGGLNSRRGFCAGVVLTRSLYWRL